MYGTGLYVRPGLCQTLYGQMQHFFNEQGLLAHEHIKRYKIDMTCVSTLRPIVVLTDNIVHHVTPPILNSPVSDH